MRQKTLMYSFHQLICLTIDLQNCFNLSVLLKRNYYFNSVKPANNYFRLPFPNSFVFRKLKSLSFIPINS